MPWLLKNALSLVAGIGQLRGTFMSAVPPKFLSLLMVRNIFFFYVVTLTHLVGLFPPGFSEQWIYFLLCQPLVDEPEILRRRICVSPGCQRVLLVSFSPSPRSAPTAGACGLWNCRVSSSISHPSSHAADPDLACSCSHQLQVPVLLPGLWLLASDLS